jgi:hypothetical protein
MALPQTAETSEPLGIGTPGVGTIMGSAFKASFAYIHVELGLGVYFEEYRRDYIIHGNTKSKAFLHPFISVGVRQR